MHACRKRAAYERELSELAVRAKPLGQDRHYRRYWWGLGAQRGCLFVEDAEARLVGAWHTIAEIDSLMQALDGRGVREQGLLAELSKVRDQSCPLCRRNGSLQRIGACCSTCAKPAAVM